jgi:hypothetical protein
MEGLRDKMYNHEVTPPNHCWENISIDLDDAAMNHEFPSNLYNMEVTPPITAWEKLNAAFNPNTDPIVKPFSTKGFPILKYAAAAIVVGIIAFTILKLVVNNNNNSDNANPVAETKDTSKSRNNLSAEAKDVVTSPNDVAKDEQLAEQNKNLATSLDPHLKKIDKKVNPHSGVYKTKETFGPETELSRSIYAYEDHVPDIAERYVMLMTPDGHFIRMAKRWSELLCCVSGEEQDADCKDQLKKWQQKIATSALAPSPANFLDILGLVNSLQENTEL